MANINEEQHWSRPAVVSLPHNSRFSISKSVQNKIQITQMSFLAIIVEILFMGIDWTVRRCCHRADASNAFGDDRAVTRHWRLHCQEINFKFLEIIMSRQCRHCQSDWLDRDIITARPEQVISLTKHGEHFNAKRYWRPASATLARNLLDLQIPLTIWVLICCFRI